MAALLGLAGAAIPPASGENIDPAGTQAQFAWGENVGWLNAEPLGDGGPGLEVDDFEVTGWIWAENLGWISASCKNTGSCATVLFGVRNDGGGSLSGFAWAENAGWIDFAPVHGGVRIQPETGFFGGFAWGENIGWVSFAFMSTSWFCDPASSAPNAAPELAVAPGPTLSWSTASGATAYDVVFGNLETLARTRGDFTAATMGCAADNYTLASLLAAKTLGPGQGIWFLVRGVNCSGSGSYDTGSPFQLGSRDDGIRASGNGCP